MSDELDTIALRERWLRLCPACDAGFGMCSHPTDDPRALIQRLLDEIDRLREGEGIADEELFSLRLDVQVLGTIAKEMLATFVHKGHPGEPCRQSGWVPEKTVARWAELFRSHS